MRIKIKSGWGGCFLWLFLSMGCSWQGNKVQIETITANVRFMPARQIHYSDFRQAVENLDFSAFQEKDLTGYQRLLISGLRQVLAGEYSIADKLFKELAMLAPSGWIKDIAADVFVNLLYFQGKWKNLQQLPKPPTALPGGADEQSFPYKELSQAGSECYRFSAQPVIMPLEFSPSGTPLIPLMINGQKIKFWLDSGATFSVLSSELAEYLHIMPINQNLVSASTGTAKKIKVQMAIIGSMKIGSLEIDNHPAMIMRRKDLFFIIPGIFRGFQGRRINNIFEISGILGMNGIRNMTIHMDFKNKKIIIAKPKNKRRAEHNLFWLGYPIVICRSMDGIPLYFGLDTGAKKSILSSTIFSKISPVAAYRARMRIWGAGGAVKINTQVLPVFKIETAGHMASFKNITSMQLHQFSLINLDGILGMDFFTGCSNMTIDLQNGLLTLNSDTWEKH